MDYRGLYKTTTENSTLSFPAIKERIAAFLIDSTVLPHQKLHTFV